MKWTMKPVSNREFEGDYEAQTDGDTVTVTIFEQNGAREVYTLNFTTAATGTGTLNDFQYLQPDQVDDTLEPTDQPNVYRDLIGSGDFTFELIGSYHHDGDHTANYHDGNHTHQEGNYSDYGHYDMDI